MANDTSTTNFAGTLVTLINRGVAENLRDNLVWMQSNSYSTAKLVKGTNQARFVGYDDLTVDASAVSTEGVANAAEEIAIGYQTLTVAQRMRQVRLTDVMMDESPHDLVSVASERIARNAAAVADFVVQAAAAALTATNFADQKANRAALTTGGVLNRDEVARMVAEMKTANIPTFPDGKYRCLLHPNQAYDLKVDTAAGGWTDANKYADPSKLLNGEIGELLGVKFIETTAAAVTPDGSGGVGDAFSIYRSYFYGPDWFAFGDLQSIKSYFVSPGGDHTDPAEQAAIVAWKGMYGVEVLGDSVEADFGTVTGGTRFRILESIGSILYT